MGMTGEKRLIVVIMAVVTLASAWRHFDSTSPDLLASWMAGLNFARGAHWDIYFGSSDLFTMRPPASWVWELKSSGHTDAIYPFIYPPLWAWLTAKLTQVASFPLVVFVANIINPLLMMGTILLAARMARGALSVSQFLIIGVVAFSMTVIAVVALEQNQPQIFVSFLLVLAAERSRSGDWRSAGAALALAASVKLYPAIFALIWIAQRDWKPLSAFVCVGGALGLTSIAVAGWPLHAEFLHELSAISGTALVTFFTHSIDATVAELFFKEQATFLVNLNEGGVGVWAVLAKTPLWRMADAAMMLSVIAGIYWFARRRAGQDALFWPTCFVALALVSPLSWGYHYLSALVFLPVLFERFGARYGLLMIAAILWPTSIPYIVLDSQIVPWAMIAQPVGTAAMACFGLALAWIIRTRLKPTSATALRPHSDPAITPAE